MEKSPIQILLAVKKKSKIRAYPQVESIALFPTLQMIYSKSFGKASGPDSNGKSWTGLTAIPVIKKTVCYWIVKEQNV
jgi:hypothetical protein